MERTSVLDSGIDERLSAIRPHEKVGSYPEHSRSMAAQHAKAILKFASVLSISLFAGDMFGILWSYDTAGLSAAFCIGELQHIVRGFNKVMPLLGAICIALTIGSALVAGVRRSLYLQIGAILCLVAAGIISGCFVSPIDNQIATWSSQAPPADWAQFRDEWWQWHLVRMILGIGALSLMILTVVARRSASRSGTFTL